MLRCKLLVATRCIHEIITSPHSGNKRCNEIQVVCLFTFVVKGWVGSNESCVALLSSVWQSYLFTNTVCWEPCCTVADPLRTFVAVRVNRLFK